MAYGTAIGAVSDALRTYAIRGWHCACLTNREFETIVADGLAPPDAAMLGHRIDQVVADGSLGPDAIARPKLTMTTRPEGCGFASSR